MNRKRRTVPRKVLMLVDENLLVPGTRKFGHEGSDWCVAQSLARLGHEVVPVEYSGVAELLEVLAEEQPDVVFNLIEHVGGDREKDAYVCGLLELMGVPYTGSSPRGLLIGRDKANSKLIARRAGFRVPEFVVVGPGRIELPPEFPLPSVVKPRSADGSDDISGASLVRTRERLIERIRHLRRRGYQQIIAEEYVPGRELLVGVVHDKMVRPKEFVYDRESKGAPLIATRSFKYDREFQKRWGIRAEYAILTRTQHAKLATIVHRASVALEVGDYCRFDVRLSPEGDWVFIEANPNPGLSPPARNWVGVWDSVDYDAMIAAIIERALARPRSTARFGH